MRFIVLLHSISPRSIWVLALPMMLWKFGMSPLMMLDLLLLLSLSGGGWKKLISLPKLIHPSIFPTHSWGHLWCWSLVSTRISDFPLLTWMLHLSVCHIMEVKYFKSWIKIVLEYLGAASDSCKISLEFTSSYVFGSKEDLSIYVEKYQTLSTKVLNICLLAPSEE